jgi:serine/threonine protein kinase
MAIQVAIDGYDSLEQIGVGGMAAVYKARKISVDKTVAIKVLFPYLATDESYIERFHREAKAAASIQHENIVNVIDFGESGGAFYIVMEYYDGRTLEHMMKARPGIPTDIAVQIMLEVAYGLEAAHSLDIVHRDIKPANIIYTSQGGIKIADFGLARKSDSMTLITQQGKVIGTPAYMSPEQAAGRPVGPASDIFSLGVVAYELLSRRKPFEGKTYSEVLEKIQTYAPPPVTVVNPLITPDFEAIVTRMLAKDENERYPSATMLITDLEAAMEKDKLSRDRRRLSSYMKDPDAYDASFSEKTIAQCLSRGAFFMHKGQDHLDDAVLEFRRILFLDPRNERARRNLEQIGTEHGDPQRTVTLDARETPAGLAHATSRPEAAGAGTAPAARKRARPRWVLGAGLVVAAAAAATWWSARDTNLKIARAQDSSRVSSLQRDGTAGAGEESRTTSPPSTAPADTASMASAARADEAPTMSATVSGPPMEKEPTVARADGERPDLAAREPEPVKQKASEPRVEPKREPAPAVKQGGALSVFFLGGVGELWIDGKKFAHQPPFEGVPMPAGTYRVACRMTGDPVPRELKVTVRPGAETVIEYELGGEPVVTSRE